MLTLLINSWKCSVLQHSQILQRKNSEIEETKNVFRAKQKESEETNRKLERKGVKDWKDVFIDENTNKQDFLLCVCAYPTVQCVLRESQVIRESKEKQIAELKKMLEHNADSLTNECEKKV